MSVPSTSSSTACLNAECASVAARTTVTPWATNTRKIRKTRSTKMYTKTRDSMPFRVYHYQLKIHFSSKVDRSEIEPSLAVSLIGTKELTSGTTNTERMEQRRNALLPLPKHLEKIFIQL